MMNGEVFNAINPWQAAAAGSCGFQDYGDSAQERR